jgi:hypothetical protein
MTLKIESPRRPSTLALVALLVLGSLVLPAADLRAQSEAAGSADRFERFWGPLYQLLDFDRLLDARRRQPPAGDALGHLRHWNTIAVDTSGLDHAAVAAGENRVFGHNLGPGRASRAMAITHIAIFDAMNAILGGYRSYTGIAPVGAVASVDAAIGQAAHDALVALFPSHAPRLDGLLQADLATIPDGRRKTAGIEVGKRAAAAILARRAHDGSHHPEPLMETDFVPNDHAGMWRMDPISQRPVALGAHWGRVDMFAPIKAASRFRVAPPPAMDSLEYALAFNEVKRLGGDGVTTPTERTPDQTRIGIYWAYDGVPSLCAPPRLYNQIANVIATKMGSGAIETARLYALIHIAMADAGTAIWESKYHYQVWRPVTGIREADAGTGPLGGGDGNPLTEGNATFTPLGAPASNLAGPNFTPPFPAYPSGHAGFGGALFQTLRRFYQTDAIGFTFVSDELNGVTTDNLGVVRDRAPRTFKNLSQAEDENGQSRIYLGIHWAFDKQDGIAQGREVADYVFRTLLTPVGQRADL